MRVFKTAVISLMLLAMSLSLGAKPKVRIIATGGHAWDGHDGGDSLFPEPYPLN